MRGLHRYVVVPTDTLKTLVQASGEPWPVEAEIFESTIHHGTPEHTEDQIAEAFWLYFLAMIAPAERDMPDARRYRAECLRLGFAGCWRVHVVSDNENAEHLLEWVKSEKMVEAASWAQAGAG